ncbi:MAG TPA: CvpA family protein [Gammaproteobacteria bacterium]|nr:CvpA family protein [Gammaproteobacteria bacterium]
MANFNGIDYVVFAVIFISIGMGLFRGFVKEVISLISWVAAFAVSTFYAVPFAALFISSAERHSGPNLADSVPTVAIIISYLALFFGVLIMGSTIKYIVNYMIEGKGVSVVNRLLGAILGFLRGGIIIALVMFFVAYTALAQSMLWKESHTVVLFKPAVAFLNKHAKPYLSIIEDKIKKAAKTVHEEENMPDVIKEKPAESSTGVPSNAIPAPATSTPAPVTTLPAAETLPPAAPALPQVQPKTMPSQTPAKDAQPVKK